MPSRKDIEDGKLDKISFCLNKSTFLNTTQGLSVEEIAQKFTVRIREEFGDMDILVQNTDSIIDVNLEEVQKTDENARKLIDMVNFVKEMVLAYC